jgi:hypothetical protein
MGTCSGFVASLPLPDAFLLIVVWFWFCPDFGRGGFDCDCDCEIVCDFVEKEEQEDSCLSRGILEEEEEDEHGGDSDGCRGDSDGCRYNDADENAVRLEEGRGLQMWSLLRSKVVILKEKKRPPTTHGYTPGHSWHAHGTLTVHSRYMVRHLNSLYTKILNFKPFVVQSSQRPIPQLILHG